MATPEEQLTLSAFFKKLVYHGQPYLVYPAAYLPRPRCIRQPSYLGLPYRDIEVTTSDNIRLRCYLIERSTSTSPSSSATPASLTATSSPSSTTNAKTSTSKHSRSGSRSVSYSRVKPKATVLMFHGNGMDHSDLLYHAKYYFRAGCNILTVSYRGYGDSEGVPSEKGLQRDAQAVLDYVSNDPELSKIPIIVYGMSLGGAVAIDVTSRNPEKITALILENTFTSIPDIVHGWPIIGPLSFVCTQRWNSASKLPKIPSTLPILFCSGRNDLVVPPVHMDNLWKIAQERGRLRGFRNGGGGGGGVGSGGGRMKGMGDVVRCTPSLGLLGLCSGGSIDAEEVPTEEWYPPEMDVFTTYPGGGHVDTCTQHGYWSAIEGFINKAVSSARS